MTWIRETTVLLTQSSIQVFTESRTVAIGERMTLQAAQMSQGLGTRSFALVAVVVSAFVIVIALLKRVT